jgi:hypothetical protein
MVKRVKIIVREIRLLLSGLLFGCLFMPAILWFLNFKYGIHLVVFKSLSIVSFYLDFYAGLDHPLVWPWLLVPYLLHSLIRQLFRSRAARATAAASPELAASGGGEEAITHLIAQGGDIDAGNVRGQTPLHLAADKGNSDVVQHLLGNGAEVDAVESGSGWTSLHYAANLGKVELCELLIRYGADTDAQTTRLETPLHLAVSGGHPDVVALLLKYHARLDIRDRNGMTSLQLAESINNREIVTLIEQHLSEVWPYLLISHG